MSRYERDNLYASPLKQVGEFSFDERVARVFPDMIHRSVPGYRDIISLTGLVAEKYVQAGTNVYDLGCSLGAAIESIRASIPGCDCRIVGVDSSPAMLERCSRLLEAGGSMDNIELKRADIRDIHIQDASLVVMNFTLQFVPVEDRLAVLRLIAAGLRPGGVLLLSEKTVCADADIAEAMIDLHHAFKRANGYSELEVSQKRAALDEVLVPESIETHQRRLHEAGFSKSAVWFQCFNFTSLIAWK